MIYKSSYIYQSGAIECGDCIYATSDADAVLMGRGRAKLRRAELFGLYEVAGRNDGGDVLRPISGKRIFRQTEDELEKAVSMLRRLEFCVDTNAQTGKDTEACPVCGHGAIFGLPGEHHEGCELDVLLRELAP